MLKRLTVRNFAVIEAITIEFQHGLNLLTGETGSGKSIIVDALGLLLGERSSLSLIRSGEKSAFVEGIFDLTGEDAEKASAILEAAGLDRQSDDEIVIRREVVATGKTRMFLDDRTVSVSLLRKLQPLLVEIHGQGEQKLLRSTRAQLDLLDTYAGCQEIRKQVGRTFTQWKSSLASLQKLREESLERVRTQELVEYQLSEIEAISPRDGEDEELARERTVMANAERILETCAAAYNQLYESDQSILASVSSISRKLRDLSELDQRLLPTQSNLEEGAILLSEAANALVGYIEGIDFSPEEFERVDNRLTAIEGLKRKFGTDLNGIVEIRDILALKLERLADSTEQERILELEVETVRRNYVEAASRLTAARRKASSKLERDVTRELQHVALQNARVEIQLVTSEQVNDTPRDTRIPDEITATDEAGYYTAYGADTISFLFSANPGEEMRPLSQVASGGELSRLMLSLLTATMKSAKSRLGRGTMIFDEIDSGIGGRVAEDVGRRLKLLAKGGQVLCVTHQAQIARFADAHYLVQKNVVAGRTHTTVGLLDQEARVREVARMIAGDNEAKTTLETARWMLETA
jgi:DNA repair protein RecN (Recombination protein N)